MPGAIEHLPYTESLLARLDARWKLVALALLGVSTLALKSPATTALAFVGAVVLAVLGRLPWRWTVGRLGLMLLVLTPFLILLPFLHQDAGPSWQLGSLRIAVAGIWSACQLALKTLTLTLLVLVLLVTAPLPATFKAAQSLRIPGLFVQLALLTYRYIFVLAGELARLRVALRVRGYRNRPSWHCYRTVGHVTGMLLVGGYEQAERVEQAMRCRGFDGTFRTLTDFQTRTGDVAAFLLIGCLAVALLAWDYRWLLGE